MPKDQSLFHYGRIFHLDHYPQFRAFLATGGIIGILRAAGLEQRVVHQELYSLGCNQIVVVAH